MATWCQNKKCPQKKTQSQIRGNKGSKYYQSNKAKHYYFNMFCGQRCMDQWFQVHSQTCLNAVGEIDKQTIPCLLYTSPSPRDVEESRMPSSA